MFVVLVCDVFANGVPEIANRGMLHKAMSPFVAWE